MEKNSLKICPYEQTTTESCLASCLLMLLDKNPTRDKELSILNRGLEFTKWNFVAGHLNHVVKYYKRKIKWYIEFEKWFDFIKILKISPLIEVKKIYINENFISKISSKNSVIVYLNSFTLHGNIHYPHTVIVCKDGSNYTIYDPWDGKSKSVSKQTLSSAISELREILNYSPQVIKIE